MFRLARPVHPGEILKYEFFEEQDLTLDQAAKLAALPVSQFEELLENRLSVDDDMAIKLSRFSGTSAQFWLNLQENFDRVTKRPVNPPLHHF